MYEILINVLTHLSHQSFFRKLVIYNYILPIKVTVVVKFPFPVIYYQINLRYYQNDVINWFNKFSVYSSKILMKSVENITFFQINVIFYKFLKIDFSWTKFPITTYSRLAYLKDITGLFHVKNFFWIFGFVGLHSKLI